jgi:hypothetical protein
MFQDERELLLLLLSSIPCKAITGIEESKTILLLPPCCSCLLFLMCQAVALNPTPKP